jgi:hypothetical protein
LNGTCSLKDRATDTLKQSIHDDIGRRSATRNVVSTFISPAI